MFCCVMKKETYVVISKWAGIVIPVIGYLVITGFALTGLGIIGFSLLTWIITDMTWVGGFGLLTGGLFLSTATVLFIGKLIKDGERIQKRYFQEVLVES